MKRLITQDLIKTSPRITERAMIASRISFHRNCWPKDTSHCQNTAVTDQVEATVQHHPRARFSIFELPDDVLLAHAGQNEGPKSRRYFAPKEAATGPVSNQLRKQSRRAVAPIPRRDCRVFIGQNGRNVVPRLAINTNFSQRAILAKHLEQRPPLVLI